MSKKQRLALAAIAATTTVVIVTYTPPSPTSSPTITHYVSPTGLPGNLGTTGSPWDLRTALAGASGMIVPDDAICLKTGTYSGHFTASVSGTPGHPIWWTNCAGSHPIIDGNLSTTTTAPILAGAIESSVTFPVASVEDLAIGDAIALDGDMPLLGEYVTVTGIAGLDVTGWRGGVVGCCAAHLSGAKVWRIASANLSFPATTHDHTVRGIEVTDTATDSRVLGDYFDTNPAGGGSAGGLRRRECVDARAPNVTLIDNVLHNCAQGIGAWQTATNFEASGNIIYNNGMWGTVQGFGHGIYTQNAAPSTKLFRQNVVLNQFGLKWQQYGSEAAFLDNFTWDQMIVAGGPITISGSTLNFGTLFGGAAPMRHLTVTNSQFYLAGVRFGYDNAYNDGLTITDTVFTGAPHLQLSKNVTFARNTVVNEGVGGTERYLLALRLDQGTGPVASDYTFGPGNAYYETAVSDPDRNYGTFGLYNPAYPNDCGYYWLTIFQSGYGYCSEPPTHSWQGLGYDTSVSLTLGRYPVNSIVSTVDAKNASRHQVVVYNWSHASTVALDVSTWGWTNGTAYTIRQAANYYVDVVSSTYGGSGPLTLAMTGHTLAVPLGYSYPLSVSTFPQFGVFIIDGP